VRSTLISTKVVARAAIMKTSTLPASRPGACLPCTIGSRAEVAKRGFELLRNVHELKDLIDLETKAIGVARRAAGAARQVVRLGKLPTINQYKFVYGRAFALNTKNVIKELTGAGVSGALSGAVTWFENSERYRRKEISTANFTGRVVYGTTKGVLQHAAGAAAAPFGAAVGLALPPLGGALAGSAIGYQMGKLLGGRNAAKTGLKYGAAVGVTVGTIALLVPGGGQAFGAAAGAIGASMWASEGTGWFLDRFVGEDRGGQFGDAVSHGVGSAMHGLKHLFGK
jgi:hypothetical protein